MGLLRTSLLVVLFCTVMSAQAANWNSGKAKPVKVKTSIPISGLTGVGINSMACWSRASEVRTSLKNWFLISLRWKHMAFPMLSWSFVPTGSLRATVEKGFKGLTKERIVAFTKAVVENKSSRGLIVEGI